MSAEWLHVPTDRLGDLHGLWCDIDAQPWPCDAEKMRVERDAAIRRAALDVERLARAYSVVTFSRRDDGLAGDTARAMAAQIAAEYQRLSQPADTEAAE